LYFLSDANFNVTTLMDTSGDAVERYLYEPYGDVTIYDGSWGSTRSASTFGNLVRYTGRECDGETGGYHCRRRCYESPVARWLSRDPIYRDPNLYCYCGDNPPVHADPNGLEWLSTPEDFGEARRKVCNSSTNDTVSALAKTLHLTPSEFTKWLLPIGSAKLPASENQPVRVAGQQFTIPNTVVEYQMVSAWPLNPPAIQVCRIAASLAAANYSIHGYKLVQVTDGTLESFNNSFRDADTAVFCFAGHGTVDLVNDTKSLTLTDGWLQPLITVEPFRVRRPFGLEFLGLYACYSANNAGRGNGYWSQFVSTTGKFEGGNGLVYASSRFVSWTGPIPPAGM
jgi:RHS repeat-associated protein